MRDIYGDEQHEKAGSRRREIEQAVLLPTMSFFDDPAQFGLEDRQGQAMLSIDIAEAISKNHHIMAEAGAGIGKSFAYLIPALLAVQKFDKSVVIATATRALGKQLVRDVEQVKLLTGILRPKVVLDRGPILNIAGDVRVIITHQDVFIRHLGQKSPLGQSLKKDTTILYIVDEAHRLEEQGRAAFATKWTAQNIKAMERALQQALPKGPTRKNHIENLRKAGEYRTQFFSEGEQQFQALPSALTKQQEAARVWLPKKHIVNYNEWAKELEKVIQVCPSSLPPGTLELPQFIRRLWQYANSSYLVWLERNSLEPSDFSICTAPKKNDNELEKLLFSQTIPVVLISDTLCNGQGAKQQRYRYYAEAVGFPEDNSELSDAQPATFNYEDNGLLYIPDDLPRPDEKSNRTVYLATMAERIADLIRCSNGRTLALFTVAADMQDVHALLVGKGISCDLLGLGATASIPQPVLEQFMASKGVLLATSDYWEEIQMPGLTLDSLIIVQLPFPPFDPIIDYRISQVLDPMEILLPEMLTKLRQGIGCLFRTDKDTGVLSILDARISDSCTLTYKDEVLAALPIANKVSSLLEVQDYYLVSRTSDSQRL